MRHHLLEDGHTDKPLSQDLEPGLPPLAGKGMEGGSHIPSPPVPRHTRLLLLQHEAGDLQHIEEGHAHDVRDGVPLVLQALLEPARELALRSLDQRGPPGSSSKTTQSLPCRCLGSKSLCSKGSAFPPARWGLAGRSFRILWNPSLCTQELPRP